MCASSATSCPASDGCSHGIVGGFGVGAELGQGDGLILGDNVGATLGARVGAVVGARLGVNVGAAVGVCVLGGVGAFVGTLVGVLVGKLVGLGVGLDVGLGVGLGVGRPRPLIKDCNLAIAAPAPPSLTSCARASLNVFPASFAPLTVLVFFCVAIDGFGPCDTAVLSFANSATVVIERGS